MSFWRNLVPAASCPVMISCRSASATCSAMVSLVSGLLVLFFPLGACAFIVFITFQISLLTNALCIMHNIQHPDALCLEGVRRGDDRPSVGIWLLPQRR